MSNVSGKNWWHANQGKYPNSRDIDDLHPDFKDNVVRFVNVLKDGGANVTISSTRRNDIRAYLMHYSWLIANEDIDVKDVPSKAGVDITWDHGNEEASKSAAKEMVDLFNLAYRPSKTSNHIKGLAVDMSISWKGDLFLGPLQNGGFKGVLNGPKNGVKNRELHEIGEQFGVKKLLKDAPHWSFNGR
jgi:hypothetical protein